MSSFTHQWLKAWNSHDVEKLRTFYDMNFGTEVVIISAESTFNDAKSIQSTAEHFFHAFPDLQFDLVEAVEEIEKVAMLWLAHGTHKGTYNNIPPTNKKLEVKGAAFFFLKNGKILRSTFLWDEAQMLRQMGLLPGLNSA